MKLWILGSQGLLGRTLLECCQARGIEAIGTSRLEGDVCHFEQLKSKGIEISPTHIVNCAAYTDVDGAEGDPLGAFAVNCEGAAHVALVAKLLGCHLVHISTDYVFDGFKQTPYREEDVCAPLNVYGKSKGEGEKKVLEILPRSCILRTSWLFGARGKSFISKLLHGFQQKEELQVVSDQWGKPTYCPYLAEAVITLLHAEGIVHFACEGEASRYQIALDCLEAARKKGILLRCQKITPVQSAAFPTPAARPSYSVLDTNKYFSLTSIHPRPWKEALNECV